MPDIPLLEPVVLKGVVEKLPVADGLTLLPKVPRTPWPFPSVTWDVVKGARNIATPNVPNSEAHIVGKLGRTQASAAFVYLREKKVFEPTTLHWLRTPGDLAARNAEKAVMAEVTDLNTRFDTFAEYLLWGAYQGQISASYGDVQIDVDYQFDPTHQVTMTTPWGATTTPVEIVNQVKLWKKMIALDGKVPATTVYTTQEVAAAIITAFAGESGLLSDRMKDSYYASGNIPGFLGLDWNVVEDAYEDESGDFTRFLGADGLIMGNFTANRPVELYEGPTADDDAPEQHTGKFSKSWKEKDPSARQVLLEWNVLPVITRVEQILNVKNLVATT